MVHLSPCANYLWTLFNSKIPWCLNDSYFQFLVIPEKIEKINKYLATPKKDGREVYVFESSSVLPSYVNILIKDTSFIANLAYLCHQTIMATADLKS